VRLNTARLFRVVGKHMSDSHNRSLTQSQFGVAESPEVSR
jgi:hypothetical protein